MDVLEIIFLVLLAGFLTLLLVAAIVFAWNKLSVRFARARAERAQIDSNRALYQLQTLRHAQETQRVMDTARQQGQYMPQNLTLAYIKNY